MRRFTKRKLLQILNQGTGADINTGLVFDLTFTDAGSGVAGVTPSIGSAATFTRASTATTVSSTGTILSVASGSPRSIYSVDGTNTFLGILIEQATTNIALNTEDFSAASWTAVSAPTRTGAAKTCGSVVLDLLGDANAAAVCFYQQAITFTGDAAKAFSIFVAQGTAATSIIAIRDNTAAADRLRAQIGWSGGVPSVSVSTGGYLGAETLANNVFRLKFQVGSVTAANANVLQIAPASTLAGDVAQTGNCYFGGVQVEDKTFCTSYIPSTGVVGTRQADSLTYTQPAFDAQGSCYAQYMPAVGALTAGIVGSNGIAQPTAFLYSPSTTSIGFYDGGVAISATGASVSAMNKACSRWTSNVCSVIVNNNTLGSGVYDGAFVGATIGIGARQSLFHNSAIKSVKLWSRALTDSEMRRITA
jgi:hypothetical protein